MNEHQRQLSNQQYIEEIEVWKKASRIHSQTVVKQYKEVARTLETLDFEKKRNESILNHLSDAVIVRACKSVCVNSLPKTSQASYLETQS